VAALAADPSATPDIKAIADMISITFFFLLRPGEYTGTASDTTPFTLRDVQCWIGQQRYLATDIPLDDLSRITFVALTFTTQKNGVRGEVIGLGRSGNPALCPVLALARRIQHLRTYRAPANTPLAAYFITPAITLIRPADITTALRTSTAVIGPSVGFLPADISARSLRAAGAMALLCAHVDTDIIRLLGRWRSDEMLRYLHVQAEPIMRDFSRRMLSLEEHSPCSPTKMFPFSNCFYFFPPGTSPCLAPSLPFSLPVHLYKVPWCRFPIRHSQIGKQVAWHVPL
jgi:hypothetical protein